MTHDPLCALSEPCDDEVPEHGYCSMQHGMFCIHCHQWCICEALGEKYAAALRDAVKAVKVYADETHKHSGDLFGHCRQEYGDRCDITAALRVAAQKIESLGGER